MPRQPPPPPLPYAPLGELIGPIGKHAIKRVGVESRTVFRWKRAGVVPLYSADKVATFLGLHPLEIWGDEYLAA